MTLGAKTAALLAVIVSSVLASASAIWLRFQETSLHRSLAQGLEGQAIMASRGMSGFVEEGLRESHAVALTLPTAALAAGRLAEVEAHLDRMASVLTKFQDGIFLLDAEGRFLTDSPRHPDLRGRSFTGRDYYQRTIREQRGVVGRAYRSARTGRPVVTFTAPVRDARGRLAAVLACSVDLLAQEALDGYRATRFGRTGYLYVVDSERRLVLHPEDARLLAVVAEGKNELLDAGLRGFEGTGETVNSMGVPMLLSMKRVPGTDWVVGVQVPLAEAYESKAAARVRIFEVSGAALLLVLVAGGLAIRRVSRPLRQLEHAAREIGAELEGGRASAASGVQAAAALETLRRIRSRDEIGLVASAFVRLAEQLGETLHSLREAADGWERTFDAVHEAVVTLDSEGRISRMNLSAQGWFRSSGGAAGSVDATSVIFGSAAPPEDWPRVLAVREKRSLRWSGEVAGAWRTLEITVTPIAEGERTVGAVVVLRDITERVESEERIREMAFFDPLTGLPNRLLLQDRLEQALAGARRSHGKAGVMFVDLDHFKQVNDLHGHDVGDDALREVVRRISTCVRKTDTFSRLGGDEFVVVLQSLCDACDAEASAERIIAALASPMIVRGRELSVGSSVGIAIFPDHGGDGDSLLEAADRAMYAAKSRGRNTYHLAG